MFDQEITQAIIPAFDGLLGILTDRAPIMVRLGIGPLRIDTPDKKTSYFFIDGGLAQMKQNTLTILTTQATAASELDGKAASDEYTKASAMTAITPKELEERDKAIQRARVKKNLLTPGQ